MQIKSQADLPNKLNIQHLNHTLLKEVTVWFGEKGECYEWNGSEIMRRGGTLHEALRKIADLIELIPTTQPGPITPKDYGEKMRAILKDTKHDPLLAAMDLMRQTLDSLGYVHN